MRKVRRVSKMRKVRRGEGRDQYGGRDNEGWEERK